MSDEFDPYYAWLGIPPKDQPPNHYRLLGLDLFETNLDVIESAAFRQMGHVRTYQSGQHSRESQRLLNELSAAKISLLDPDKKRDYDELLRATIESIKTFLPEESGGDPTAHQTSKSGTSSIHVIDFDSNTASSESAAGSASVSAIRHKRPQPASRIPTIIGFIIAVVCLGIAGMFGNKFLTRGQPVANQPPAPTNVSPAPEPLPTIDPPDQDPVATNTPPDAPVSNESTQQSSTTPANATDATATVSTNPQPSVAVPSKATAGMPTASTATAGTRVTAAATHALRFDGSARVAITNTSELATRRNTFTAEMWFRCTEPSINEGYVLMGTTARRDPPAGSNIGTASGWHVTAGRTQGQRDAQETALRYASATGSIRGSGAGVPELGNGWHHLAVCNSPADGNFQLDVFLDGTRTQSNKRSLEDAALSTADFFLGKAVYLPDRHAFIGDVKAFRLSSEVRYRDTFTPPQAFSSDNSTLVLLNFSGAPSNYAADISGNLRHGIISGAKWVLADAPATGSMAVAPEPSAGTLSQDRMPVPSGEDRIVGSKKVKDVFATEFEAAKDKPAMISLAKDLLRRGKEEQEAVAKFALLYESRALMLEAADLAMAMETTNEVCAWFEVDLWTLKCDTLSRLAASTRPDVDRQSVAATSLELADEAMSNSAWDSAEKLLAAATRVNVRLKDREVVRTVKQKQKQLQTHKKLWEDAEQAATLLATTPDDAAANLKVGRYRCFVTGEWDVGLSHLAKGSDAQLLNLAELEAKNPQGADSLALANQWYEWGEKATESDKNGALLRAKHWYTSALPSLSGLDRTVAEKKLEELNGKVEDTATNSKQLAWLNGPVGELKRLEGHTAEVTSLDVSKSGTMLVSGSTDGTVRFWDLAEGKETGKITSSVSRIVKVALFRDDQFVFVAGSGTTAEVWNARTGRPATSMTILSSISSAALSGDKDILACARRSSSSGNITLYNMGTGAAAGLLNCPTYPDAVAVSRTGRLVAAGSGDGNVYVWNIASGQVAAPFAGLGGSPNDVVISPNEQLVAACASSQVMVWELATGKMLSRSPMSNYASQLAFSPDSRRIVCAGMMHEVTIINVEDGQAIQNLTGQVRGGVSTAKAINYLPDPRGAVSAGYDGIIRVWRLPD